MNKKAALDIAKRAAQRQLLLVTGREPILQHTRTNWHSSHGLHGFWFDFSTNSHFVTISGTYKKDSDTVNRLTVSSSPKES